MIQRVTRRRSPVSQAVKWPEFKGNPAKTFEDCRAVVAWLKSQHISWEVCQDDPDATELFSRHADVSRRNGSVVARCGDMVVIDPHGRVEVMTEIRFRELYQVERHV